MAEDAIVIPMIGAGLPAKAESILVGDERRKAEPINAAEASRCRHGTAVLDPTTGIEWIEVILPELRVISDDHASGRRVRIIEQLMQIRGDRAELVALERCSDGVGRLKNGLAQ